MHKNWSKDYPSPEGLTEEVLDENSSLKKMLDFIGSDKTVVDFGCATGYFANLLQQKDCIVTGIEINPDAAKVAEKYCQNVIVADLDFVSITEILANQKFDVAIFGDILEHLRNPWKVLEETKSILKEHGFVVASIPNIAHGAIRLALLEGKFEYRKLGILDDTHLRFFTRETTEELLQKSGYLIDELERTKLPLFSDSDLVPKLNENHFSKDVIQYLQQDQDIDTLQFIVRAFPLSQEGEHSLLNTRYHKVLVERDFIQSQLQQTQAELERSQCQLQETQAELEEIRRRSPHIPAEIEVGLQPSVEEVETLKLQLQNTQTELERSQHIITAMESSKFWEIRQIWFKLKKIIGGS
ncbi:methyltransferase domain-containing protein [Nodularia spumigena CS-584]|jgi:O-antigen biosynthesis protein|uniref:Methyltransferase domain-containing protein n=1 Tax=Nodularia spumigena UHCC 0060 TaxID=3110300 RepID=A0ABU5USP1_NODSP|nr:class I SAM-dependent methyltransferase [Nodularia spumigena]AHJ26537.1 Guanylate kinase [Nodularia spumigena CCY9414]MDB9303955.1 methyltransferase domain-containing protein [Nodularia spumigena CS-591/12]MDB9381430.1 methyltransferase domain-containing protein [Nodularia spumigena CS-584]MEA5524567.1 methyltransferase domain-containing protein [Nodularia spumigena UHCC 0143]MEA5555514.1 methyltransferase domain-containing protein [Nodularia spumigena CH309]